MQFASSNVPGRLAALALACLLGVSACSNDSAPSLIASGKEFLAKKEPRKALIQFKSALQKDPQSAEARFLLGQALLDAGDPTSAVVELSKALDQRFDDNQVLPPLARAMLLSGGAKKLSTLYGDMVLSDKAANAALKVWVANAWGVLGDKAKVQTALDAALAAVPDFPAAVVLQARLQASQGQFDEALRMVDQVLAREAANAEAWHLRGELLVNVKKDTKGGEEAFAKALAIEPAFMAAHLALITQRLRASDVPGAKAQADKLRAVLPRHPQTLFVDARLALLDQDLKKARDLTQQLLRIAPENVGVLQLAGAVEGMGGSLVVSETHFSKALQIEPNLPVARRDLARTYLRQGQPLKALRTLEPMLGAAATDAEALALGGEAQLQLGDPRAAEALFLQAAKLSPSDPKLGTALALMKLSRGDAEAAFAQLDGISAGSSDTAADMAIISARLKRKEYDAALRALDAMAKKQPKSATVAELRGFVHTSRKDYAAARQAFEQALVIEPTRFSAVANLASLDLSEGKPDQARKRLEAAVAADNRNHSARMSLASLLLRQGAPLPEVQEILAAGIKASPSEAGPRLQLVELLLLKKQFKEALAAAQEATAALPNDSSLLDALGRAQMLAGDTQQATSTFRKLASVDTKSSRPHVLMADLMNSTGNRDGAIASLRRALEVDPTNDGVQVRLMDMLSASGKPKDALQMARDMQLRNQASAIGYLLEGAIHRRVKAPAAAVDAYRAGLRQAQEKSALAVELHKTLIADKREAEADRFGATWMKEHVKDIGFEYHLATIAILRKDLDRAEVLLTHVLSQRPDAPLALNNLAWVLASRGKPGAVAYAQKAAELLPNRPAVMDTLALALAADKQLPKALEIQKKAIEIAPGDMGLRLNLAKIAIQAGDKALARAELDRLAAQGTKLSYHAEVTRLLKTL